MLQAALQLNRGEGRLLLLDEDTNGLTALALAEERGDVDCLGVLQDAVAQLRRSGRTDMMLVSSVQGWAQISFPKAVHVALAAPPAGSSQAHAATPAPSQNGEDLVAGGCSQHRREPNPFGCNRDGTGARRDALDIAVQ